MIRSPTPLLNTKLKELPKNTTKRDLTLPITKDKATPRVEAIVDCAPRDNERWTVA